MTNLAVSELPSASWLHALRVFTVSALLNYCFVPWSLGFLEDFLSFLQDIVIFLPGVFFAI